MLCKGYRFCLFVLRRSVDAFAYFQIRRKIKTLMSPISITENSLNGNSGNNE